MMRAEVDNCGKPQVSSTRSSNDETVITSIITLPDYKLPRAIGCRPAQSLAGEPIQSRAIAASV
jgi:hypothetical protein